MGEGKKLLRLLTFNVKGLQDAGKLGLLVAALNRSPAHVLMLQEAHLPLTTFFPFLSRHVPFLSPDPTSPTARAGVAFFVDRDLQPKEFKEHVKGRVASLEVTWLGETYWILNVYAPNDPAGRVSIFRDLPLPPISTHALVGGDFNCLEDPRVDKIGERPGGPDPSVVALASYTGALDLEDSFRTLHPGVPGTTCSTVHLVGGVVSRVLTRLDRWYAPKALLPRLEVGISSELAAVPSDHTPLSLSIGPPATVDRGPGYWKFNTSLLQDLRFRNSILSFFAAATEAKHKFPTVMDWWDWCKVRFKQIAISHASVAKAEREKQRFSLEVKVKEAEVAFKADPGNSSLGHRFEEARKALSEHLRFALEGARIRSRAQWMSEGERPTKYFFSLEKARREGQSMSSLLDERGDEVSSATGMLDVARNFYSRLYSPEPHPSRKAAQERVLRSYRARLSQRQKDLLDGPITLEELTRAVNSSASGKAPGLDGIPVEFYKSFWKDMGPHLLQVFKAELEEDSISLSQRNGVISLLYKKGDRRDMGNWRPVSLLTADFKLLSKVLASRLGSVLPDLLSSDQTAVKGRWIMDSVHTVQAVLDHLKSTGKAGGLLFLDQEKAFDRVDHDFLFAILAHLGFPQSYIGAIRTMYSSAYSVVRINNHLSAPFRVRRGVRQGDPLSPLLFTLVIESLACAIRADPELVGVTLPGVPRPVKVCMYADDTAIAFCHPRELRRVNKILELYAIASDAKLNRRKSQGFFLNGPLPPPDAQLGMEWLPQDAEVRYLGVPVGRSVNVNQAWQSITQKIVCSSRRNLSLQGRILLIKSLALSKLQYLSFALPLPKDSLSTLEKLVWSFIWKGKRDKVARSTLSLPKGEGGLSAALVPEYLASLRLKVLQRLLHPPLSPPAWIPFRTAQLSQATGEWGLSIWELLSSSFPPHRTSLPSFWIQVLKDWQRLRPSLSLPAPSDSASILSQPLFHNPNILSPKGKPFSEAKWLGRHQSGTRFIADLWGPGRWKTPQEIRRETGYGIAGKTLDSLIVGVPAGWCSLLRNVNEAPRRLPPCSTMPRWILFGKPLRNCSVRDFRQALCHRPASQPRWEGLGVIPWARVWRSISLIPDRGMRDLQYLLLHKALPVGERIRRWWPDALVTCPDCGVEETFSHLFFECPRTRKVWNIVEGVMRRRLAPSPFKLDWKSALLGLFPCPRRRRGSLLVWRIVQPCALQAIWAARCRQTFSGEPASAEFIQRLAALRIRTITQSALLVPKVREAVLQSATTGAALLLPFSTSAKPLFHHSLR